MTGDRSRTAADAGDDRPRVLVVTQFFPPETMGGGHRWQRFAEENADEFAFRVVCPPPTYPFGEFEQSYRPWATDRVDGVPVTRLWTYQPGEDVTPVGRMLNYGVFAALATLYVLLTWWRYDAVVTMSTPHTTFLPGAVAKLLGRAWVVDVFDLWLDNAADLGYVDRSSPGFRFVAWLESLAMRRADAVVVLTPTMARYYAEKHDVPESRFTPVPFGVDAELFAPRPDADAEQRAIYVGNLGTFYAFEPFLEGFAQLDEGYELLVVGWGEREAELKDLVAELGIRDRVTFAGAVPRKQIPALLAESALSWVPLKTDQQLDYARPTKLLESMAVGTPYVASPVEEVRVVTERSGGGLLVENDADEVAEAMRRLFEDEELRVEMGENAVEFVEEEHRWEALGERVKTVLIQSVD